jgi:hypothetical protein
VKVLFITGFGRSGTTVVDSILGQVEGCFSLGEAQYVWDRGLERNLLCGCGSRFRECSFWGPLAGEIAGDLGAEDLRSMARLRDRQGPGRAVARAALGRLGTPSAAWRSYVERTAGLYRAVQHATGARVLIDSSKSPSHGLVLDRMREQIPELELFILHMVRNPRAVAHAWQKRKVYDASGDEPMYMARLSLHRSATKWLGWNAAIEILWRRRERYLLLPYERFAADPRGSIEAVVEHLGERDARLPFTGPRTVELSTVHSVAGNPNRFATGPVEIRNDEAWKGKMSAGKQLAVAGLTWPLLARYGYLRPLMVR